MLESSTGDSDCSGEVEAKVPAAFLVFSYKPIWKRDVSYFYLTYRVADTGCLSRIPDTNFYLSRISDPGSNNSTKRVGGKYFFVLHLFVATNVINFNNFIFEQAKKVFLSQNTKN
jgi:hypothetical protein